MGVFSRSWQLTKLSFGVIKRDKEMLWFPLLAGFFSLLYSAALLAPTILVQLAEQSIQSVTLTVLDYVLLFATYLGLAFIATFFNVCVVFTTKTRFEGGDATFMDSLKFAFSRIHVIFSWALVSATVGLFLRALDQAAQRAGAAGKIVIGILTAVLGMMWSIITLFVVPAMVYDNLGPIDGIKRSVKTLKSTWGESLIRHYGLGLMQFLFLLLGVIVGFALFVSLSALGPTGVIIAVGVTVVYCLGVILVFTVANTVFNTALYAYANGGSPPGFDDATLAGTFGSRK